MRARTANLLRARQALSQLSYSPILINPKYQGPNSKNSKHHEMGLIPLGFGFLSLVTKNPAIQRDCRVGLSGVEPLTSRLSGVRSNQLSYRPLT